MEVLLHLWDELDDLSGTCRHLATAAASEFLAGAASVLVGASALAAWLLEGAYRQLLRLSA